MTGRYWMFSCGYKGLQLVTRGHRRLQGFKRAYERLQGLQGVTGGYKGLVEV